MKKILLILLASVFLIAACNGDNDDTGNGDENENDQTEENDEENTDTETDTEEETEEGQQEVYQIGETASSENSSYGFPYDVTVNSFDLTTDEVEGFALDDFFSETSSPGEDTRFALVNVTIANTGDEGFVVNDSFTPVMTGEMMNEYPELDAMPAFEEEIAPGEEITADLVFITDTIYDEAGSVDLFFNIHDPNVEFRFELPIP